MMTTHAREVLTDCERALADFEAGAATAFWRTRWAAVVALLRAVGHVLDKVDGDANSQARRAIDQAWKRITETKPEPAIFWQFIEEERNNVLKTYIAAVHVNTTVRPGTAWLNLRTGESGGGPSGPTSHEYFFRDGPLEGRDPLHLCREAVTFWHAYLDAIDAAITRSNG